MLTDTSACRSDERMALAEIPTKHLTMAGSTATTLEQLSSYGKSKSSVLTLARAYNIIDRSGLPQPKTSYDYQNCYKRSIYPHNPKTKTSRLSLSRKLHGNRASNATSRLQTQFVRSKERQSTLTDEQDNQQAVTETTPKRVLNDDQSRRNCQSCFDINDATRRSSIAKQE